MANTIIIIYIVIITVFLASILFKDYAKKKEEFFKIEAIEKGNILFIPLYAFTQNDKNFSSYCFELFFNAIFNLVKQIFPALIQPVLIIIYMIKGIFAAIEDQMSVVRGRLAILRQFLMNVIQTIMEKLSNIIAALVNQMLRLKENLKRFFALFRVIVYISQVSVDTLMSFINGPIGDLGIFVIKSAFALVNFTLGPIGFAIFPQLFSPEKNMFCFDQLTPIRLTKGFKYIKNINIGDTLYGNNRVVSKLQLRCQTDMYYLDGDTVSGNHKVLYNEKYIYVYQHPKSYKITYTQPYIYCLNTTNHTIDTPSYRYADYDEILDREYYHKTLSRLNNQIIYSTSNKNIPLYLPGFIIYKNSNVLDDENINGIIYNSIEGVVFYNYNNIICSGSTIVLHQDKYTFVENIGLEHISIKLSDQMTFVHFITNNSTIQISNTIFRDYNNI